MEIVVLIIMILVAVSFILKLACHKAAGIAAICAVATVFTGYSVDFASMQSKTMIADWLADTSLMLDIAVILTVDVFVQIAFCILYAKSCSGRLTRNEKIALYVTGWFPGALIFPVLLALVVELVFSLPGVDFALIGRSAAGAVAVFSPLAAAGAKYLRPEAELRAELIFLVNLLIAALGVVATVNGRTAAAGTSEVEWGALAGVSALIISGAFAGSIIYRYMNKRKISKLS